MARSPYGLRTATGGSVQVEGLLSLQRALRHTEGRLDKNLKKELVEIAKPVRDAARANAPKRSGQLARSIRIGVARGGVSIYSSLVYSLAIEEGAWTRTGRGPHISRSSASHYMKRAVEAKSKEFADALDDLMKRIESDYLS